MHKLLDVILLFIWTANTSGTVLDFSDLIPLWIPMFNINDYCRSTPGPFKLIQFIFFISKKSNEYWLKDKTNDYLLKSSLICLKFYFSSNFNFYCIIHSLLLSVFIFFNSSFFHRHTQSIVSTPKTISKNPINYSFPLIFTTKNSITYITKTKRDVVHRTGKTGHKWVITICRYDVNVQLHGTKNNQI